MQLSLKRVRHECVCRFEYAIERDRERAGSGAVGDPRRSAANFGLNTAGIETDTNSIREKLSTGHD